MMSQEQMNAMKFVIFRFNQMKGRKFGFGGNEALYEKYADLVDKYGAKGIVAHISDYKGNDIHEFFDAFRKDVAEGYHHEEKSPVVGENNGVRSSEMGEESGLFETVKAEEPVASKQEEGAGLGLLEKAIASGIANSIMANVEQRCDRFIKEAYGVLPKIVKIQTEKTTVEVKGTVHERFTDVLQFVAHKVPVFLSGPAGSGKNVICKQVAESLGLEFYFSNAVTQEYKLTGFTDANGRFHESQFYKAFTNGGLFFLDEMDASVPEVLIILNAAIANGYFDFPAPIGKVDAHDTFRVIAAGNTFGLGASVEYTGRNQLDAASLDRFAVIEVGYSEAIELLVTENDKDLCEFVRSFRKVCAKNGVMTVASYRALKNIHTMEQVIGLELAIKSCLTKNLRSDDVKIIEKEIECAPKYKKVLKSIATA